MGRSGVTSLLLASLVALGGCSSSDPEAKPVIVDYSPTVSDVGALLYLLSNPDVNVLAVTLPVTGEAGCDLGVEVTLGILAMLERSDIPVACDPDLPPDAGAWPDAFVAGNDALALALPDPVSTADARPAHELIADVVAESPDPVTLYAVAPLTNVARAIDRHPQIRDGLDEIIIMGGAVDVPGNVAGTNAEWNLWIDVPAAAAVVESEVPITLVPLDATDYVPTPGFWQVDLAEARQSAAVSYLGSMVSVFPQVTSGFFYLWDELAAAVAAGVDAVETAEMNIVVVEEQGAQYGATIRDPDGRTVTVATAVPDPDEFYAHFLSTLSGAEATVRSTLQLTGESIPVSVGPESSPEEVLAFWLTRGLAGDVAPAASVVAPGAPWVGLGESPDVFVAGSGPYEAFDVELSCSSAGQLVLCNTSWNDLWLDANPDIERGHLRVRAEVVDGVIVGFEEFSFAAEIGAAFDGHLTWLATEMPDQLAAVCSGDGASPECSDLLVATAADWVASR